MEIRYDGYLQLPILRDRDSSVVGSFAIGTLLWRTLEFGILILLGEGSAIGFLQIASSCDRLHVSSRSLAEKKLFHLPIEYHVATDFLYAIGRYMSFSLVHGTNRMLSILK